MRACPKKKTWHVCGAISHSTLPLFHHLGASSSSQGQAGPEPRAQGPGVVPSALPGCGNIFCPLGSYKGKIKSGAEPRPVPLLLATLPQGISEFVSEASQTSEELAASRPIHDNGVELPATAKLGKQRPKTKRLVE